LLIACATATREDLPSGEGDSGSGGASGSSASGGATSGGVTSGGTAGTATGGASGKGGTDTGGSDTGGSSTGGTSGKGGTDTGGTSGATTGGGAGKGGASPFGGASGMPAGGTGGKAGSGGVAGASGGAGGSAGTTVVPPTGECAMSPTLALSYKVNQTGDAIGFDLKLTNTGPAPIAANQIEFQYYISQEESAWQERVLDVYAIQAGNYMDIKTTGSVTVDPLMPALGAQTHVIRVRQTSGALLAVGTSSYLQLTVRLQPNPSAPNQNQSNDFSYDAAHATLAAWDHVAVFVNGTLAFGCTPEA